MTYTGVNQAFANLYSNSKNGVDVNQARNAVAKAAQGPSIDTSNPMQFLTDRMQIKDLLDLATQDAFRIQRRQAQQDNARFENSLIGDRNATILGMRNATAGGVAGGSTLGATNASALQAALGLGMKQDANLNMGLQGLQNLAAQEQAARSLNGSLAIDKSNAAKGQQSTLAAEKYASDATFASTGLQALASLFWPGYDGSQISGSSSSSSSSNSVVDNTPLPKKKEIGPQPADGKITGQKGGGGVKYKMTR